MGAISHDTKRAEPCSNRARCAAIGLAVSIWLLFGLAAHPAAAAPGDLDTTFDTDGIVTENVGSRVAQVQINAVARQSDGKIVAGGRAGTGDTQFLIARYNTNGTLDASFGDNGAVILTVGRYHSFANDVAIQSDGKIVAVGWAFGDFGVIRLNTDGSLDTSFGGDGIVTTDFNANTDLAEAVTIDGSGKIVVGGAARSTSPGNNDDFGLARYNTDGTLDTSFSSDGLTTTPFPAGFGDKIFDIAIDAAGKVVAAGNGSGEFGVARYNTDGSLDTNFDTDGLATTGFSGFAEAKALAIAGGGEITAVGRADGEVGIARYTALGAPDNTLDTDGKLMSDDEDLSGATGVVLSGEKTVVSATTNGFGDEEFTLARFNADGSLDTDSDADPGISLGGDGIVKADINGGDDFANALLEDDLGNLVLGGRAKTAGVDQFALARFNSDGTLDNSFSDDGVASNGFNTGSEEALFAVAETPEGKLVAVGEITFGGALDFLVMRFNANGSLDTSFDDDGIVTTDLGSADSARAVAVQSDGKILVGGSSGGFSGKDFAIARYNADGSLDTDSDDDPSTDWGLDGTATEDLGSTVDRVNALAIQSDGKVVAAGLGDDGFGLARFDEFGDLDDSFDGESGNADGSFTTSFGATNTQAMDVAIDGTKIIAAGGVGTSNADFALARYDIADGDLDDTFDADGKVTTDFAGNFDSAAALAIQDDGKIVASGGTHSGDSNGGIDFGLARYLTNGTLDPTFGTGGKVATSFVGDNEERAQGVAIQDDGRIVAGGFAAESSSFLLRSFALARYEADGSPDTSFDSDGRLISDLGATSSAADLLLTSGAKIVLAGSVYDGSDDVALARYETGGAAAPNRTLDVTLTGDGAGRVTGPGIDCPGDCTHDYPSGTALSLTAAPTGGSSFEGWGGECTGKGDCSLTMNADRQVSAEFKTEPEPPVPPDPPDEPDFPKLDDADEVDGVDAFGLELDVNRKGLIKATVEAAQPGRVVAKASTRKKGKRFKYKKKNGSVKPHKQTNLKLKPTRKVKRLLKKSKRPQKFDVTVKYLPAGGKLVYKQRSEVRADIGRSQKIAKWIQVYVGTSTRFRLDSKRGIVVNGTLGFGRADAIIPSNSKVPTKLDGLAKSACADSKPTVELLRMSPTGEVYGSGPVFGRPENTEFFGARSWQNNVWPALGEDSNEWSVLVRTGWPSGPFGLGSLPTNPKVKFKGKRRTVFCSGSQVSFPHPFVPDPRD